MKDRTVVVVVVVVVVVDCFTKFCHKVSILCQDRFYLEEDELARQLVEIGCRKGEAS